MKYPQFIELDGKMYMSTKTAAEVWNLKPSTVSEYCKQNKVFKAIKYLGARWYISIDAVKPLSDSDVRRFLVLTIQLKNKPSLEIDWTAFQLDFATIEPIYRYLVYRELIENFGIVDEKRIPYEVVLTQKGLEFATSGKKEKIEDFGSTIKEWLPAIIGAAQLIVQIAQIAAA